MAQCSLAQKFWNHILKSPSSAPEFNEEIARILNVGGKFSLIL